MNYDIEPTHRRKPVKGRRGSKVLAQLLSLEGGLALLRVAFKVGKERIVRHTSVSEDYFERAYVRVA